MRNGSHHGSPSGGTGTRIAILGGGNGISAVLRGLADLRRGGLPLEITAVVTTADDGGSSGRLRKEHGVIPPGDIRSCLLALAPDPQDPLYRLFAHRFPGNGESGGHVLGNLALIALASQDGDFLQALKTASRLLKVTGAVLPATLDRVQLEGRTQEGRFITGESRIGTTRDQLERVWLHPVAPEPAPGVLETIRDADLVVLGPGSLFTSLLPVLLVPGISRAIRNCAGRTVLIANMMTQPGETLGMTLRAHLDAIDHHVGDGLVQDVLLHSGPLDADRVRPYALQEAGPVEPGSLADREELFHRVDLANSEGKVRHDPVKIAGRLLALAGVTSMEDGMTQSDLSTGRNKVSDG